MPDPNDPNYLSLDDDQLGLGYGNPASPYPALSSIGAMGGNYQLPPMPNAQRAAQLASQVTDPDGTVRQAQPGETPDVAKSVHPAWWRMLAGIGAEWFTRRHPQVGGAVANALTETDPNVQRHQDLLNQYNIAAQQAQSERQMLGPLAMLGYRQGMLANAQARIREGIARGQQAAGAEPVTDIPSSSVAPPPTPQAQLPNVTGLGPAIGAPNFNQPSASVTGPPPVVSPGAQVTPPGVSAAMQANAPKMTNQIAGYQQVREPFTGAPLQIPPASEKANTELVTSELAQAAKRPELAGQRVTPAMWDSLNRSAEQNTKATAPGSAEQQFLSEYAKKNPGSSVADALKAYKALTPSSPEQQFIDEYRTKNPGSSIADAEKAYKTATQPPERPEKPPQALMIGPDGKAMVVRPGTIVPQGAQTPAGVNATNTLPGQTRATAAFAKTITDQIPNVLGEIDALKERIGPGAGRWNELWVNKAGMNDPAFAGLDQDLKMLSSALVRVHFGLRGGDQIRAALEKQFSEAQSPEDLKSRIQHAESWIKGYAHPENAGKGGGGQQIIVSASDGKDHPFTNEKAAKIFEESVKAAGGTTSRK